MEGAYLCKAAGKPDSRYINQKLRKTAEEMLAGEVGSKVQVESDSILVQGEQIKDNIKKDQNYGTG